MIDEDTPRYQPNNIKCPGQVLKETLDDMGIEYSEFYKKAGIDKDYFYLFVDGKAAMSPELAVRLEKWAKLPLWLWQRYEKRWQDFLQMKEEDTKISSL